MERTEILDGLRDFKQGHQKEYRFTKIGLFGSVARGQSTEQSDIDIVVEQQEPDLFLLGCIKTDLEETFERKVDLVRFRKGMNELLRKRIEQDAVYA